MAVTKRGDFNFENQVRLEHAQAYFRKKLLWSKFAEKFVMDFNKKAGEKLDVPYFDKMGAAEKPMEDARLAVDNLADNSFSATVYEAGKAWGITDAGRVRKAMTEKLWEQTAEGQAVRVMAELVDADALAVLNNAGSSNTDGASGNEPAGHDSLDDTKDITITSVFTGKKGADTAAFKAMELNVRDFQESLTEAFGDRQDEAKYSVMHSRSWTSMITDSVAGLLKADANSPFQGLNEYKGNFLGKETFMIDNVPKGPVRTITDSAGTKQKYQTYKHMVFKPQPYLLVIKKDMLIEDSRDILGRIDISAATQWYCFTTLHKRVDSEDIRAMGKAYITNEQVV